MSRATDQDHVIEIDSDNGGLSVWATAQDSPAAQRKNRYVPESTAHPGKMLPAIAAHAIRRYTQVGDVVVDPMCGIGTTLVEALRLGRRAVGVEYERRWADVARANVDLALHHGARGEGQVFRGDARYLPAILPARLVGQAALVITSPPYGSSTHGQVATTDNGIRKRDWRYSTRSDHNNLAYTGPEDLLIGFTDILAGCMRFLRPGGHVVITVRPWRQRGQLIDLPSHILACAQQASLIPVERCVALLARVADQQLVPHGSFFQRDYIRKQREAGWPLHLIAHEDVLILATRGEERV